MQRVLRKRVFRDLKENFFRYLALGLMIVMGIFLVVTIVGSGETLTRGTERIAGETKLEDGEFKVFVPLTQENLKGITDMGIEVREQFYFDYLTENEEGEESTLRIFRVRDGINEIYYTEGKAPADKNEIVVEKRYAEEHDIQVGDGFELAGTEYLVCGIGVTSDYDGPFKEISDTSCNSKYFGNVFLTKDAYLDFRASGKAQKSEDYLYSYRLGGGKTDRDLKNYLKDLKINAELVDDELFQEYWDRTGGIEKDLRGAVEDLREATDKVHDGLEELAEHNGDLKDGTAKIFEAYLVQAQEALVSGGLEAELREDTYGEELDRLIEYAESIASVNPYLKPSLEQVKSELDALKEYQDGLGEYVDGVQELSDGTGEMADGVQELDDAVEDALDAFDFELSNLTMFLKREDNPRIFATKNDKIVDIEVGMIAGVILLVLMAYVISVFVVHSIESESSIIGTLYSMGVTKNDLILHYVTLPVVVTFISGLAGALVASTGVMAPMIAESSYLYFSIPTFAFSIPGYLWIYSVVIPPIVAVIVNVLVINGKLNRTALSLIRNEGKQGKNRQINLRKMNFVTAFRIRQMLNELRSSVAVVFGMLISLLVFMISVDCYILCSNIAKDYEKDTGFEYMYTLKYPEKEAPQGAEAAYAYTCKKATMGFNFDVTILGIDEENSYFDIHPDHSKESVIVSSAFAEKFKLKKGEEFVVTDEEKEMKYAFSVKEIAQYSPGFFIFMDLDTMREMFGEAEDYYNVLFTDRALDIDAGRLYSTTSRSDVVKGASVFTDLMMPMVYTLTFASIIIFCVVMYLMMKVMIDRSAHNISLIKVFGYRRREIKKLYLDGNFYIIAVGALICLPLSKKLMDMAFPYMISNVTCGFHVDAPLAFYVIAYVLILALYFVINAVLVRKLDRYTPAEVLKNRE